MASIIARGPRMRSVHHNGGKVLGVQNNTVAPFKQTPLRTSQSSLVRTQSFGFHSSSYQTSYLFQQAQTKEKKAGGSEPKHPKDTLVIKLPDQEKREAFYRTLKPRALSQIRKISADYVNLAQYNGILADIRKDVQTLLATFKETPSLLLFLQEKTTNKEEVLQEMQARLGIRNLTTAFVTQLINENEIKHLVNALNYTEEYIKCVLHEREANLTTAKEISKEEVKFRTFELKRKLMRDDFQEDGKISPVHVVLSHNVNPSLLDGYILETDTWSRDMSANSAVEAKISYLGPKYLPIKVLRDLPTNIPEPHPKKLEKEKEIQTLKDLTPLLEFKKEALSKLKDDFTLRTQLSYFLIDAIAFTDRKDLPRSVESFVQFEKLSETEKNNLKGQSADLIKIRDEIVAALEKELKSLILKNHFMNLPSINPMAKQLLKLYIQAETEIDATGAKSPETEEKLNKLFIESKSVSLRNIIFNCQHTTLKFNHEEDFVFIRCCWYYIRRCLAYH